ncbi:DUF805 domain-containing protein [Helicobacter sp. MIT 11-5569]|uniref:DUF805 domain-containing protein n=1 Tax=Helicobacter sp. MIT 11-5569 TaxID=1548151 RepID=UPI00051F9624|nr:DUF805 domain-containing protein [Helicobacter sp. MIT 11-5569]TLD82914.1 DUF805 domain-containing protein [Helicobacter sp. MIT 11-5569]
MTFKQAVASGFSNLFNFKGRASRSEYWWFYLCLAIIGSLSGAMILGFAFVGYYLFLNGTILYISYIIYQTFAFVFLMFYISITVRRLHDVNKSGWWLLVWFVSYILMVFIGVLSDDTISANTELVGIALSAVLFALLASSIILLIFLVKRGTKGENRFGADPLCLSAQEIDRDNEVKNTL